jgi:HK97 family phage portal protein
MTMSIWDRVTSFLALEPMQERTELGSFPDIDTQVARIRERQVRPGRHASVAEALSVPAIQRCVTLISHTLGSLSMQGWYNGSPMPQTPVVLARPNPYETPYAHYYEVGYYRATRGENIMWIANRDSAGFPIALVNVPPWEMSVQANPANRLRPTYYWGNPERPRDGDITGTRYSPANPEGSFVHIMYHKDQTGLRGIGPLQMCGAAVSVAVEAQQWATNFYHGGGVPPLVVKKADELDTTTGPDGLTEAEVFKRDWMSGHPNEPKIIDIGIESVEQFDANPQGAQMLDARQYENGDAARMFGIPGVLLEYNMTGSSLTYQSIPDVWIEFLRGCLQPSYLEPIEAQMSDLLPRTQVGRFNTNVLQRADIKTRFETYNLGVPLGIISVEQAQQAEGYLPGDIEMMPVPPSPPAAVVGLSKAVRCTGQLMIRGVVRRCNLKLAESGTFEGRCRRCGAQYPSVA